MFLVLHAHQDMCQAQRHGLGAEGGPQTTSAGARVTKSGHEFVHPENDTHKASQVTKLGSWGDPYTPQTIQITGVSGTARRLVKL